MAHRALGLVLVIGTLSLLDGCRSCSDVADQPFEITPTEAATILDADGQPTRVGCERVCGAVRDDGGHLVEAGVRFPGNQVSGCQVVSDGAHLLAVCFHELCAL